MMEQLTLQRAVLPDKVLDKPLALYFKTDASETVHVDQKQIKIPAGCTVSFDSFFNSFDLSKWRSYTNIENIGLNFHVAGAGELQIYRIHNQCHKLIYSIQCSGPVKIDNLPLAGGDQLADCRIYLKWQAAQDSTVSGFEFFSVHDDLSNEKLALVITTFNRQSAITATLSRFEGTFANDAFWAKHIHVYVVDNGDNLAVGPHNNITYIANKNLGGAGGFSRGLYEVKQAAKASYCIFMDDDACCELESIRRAFVFMVLSKNKQQMIAGSMLYEDNPGVVYEAGAQYPVKQLRMRPLKNGVDVTTSDGLARYNQDTDDATYAAWWFCGFRVDSIKHYAFPYFVRGDDILFGIMHSYKVVTLSGIATWQMNFNLKYSALVEYLSVRGLIVPAFIYPTLKKRLAIPFWVFSKVLLLCFSYRYSSAEAIIAAYNDVLSGPAFWQMDIDAKLARARIAQLSKDEQPVSYPDGDHIAVKEHEKSEGYFSKLLRLCTLNGHLIPTIFLAKRAIKISNRHIHPTRKVFMNEKIYYQTQERKYIVLQRDCRRFYHVTVSALLAIFNGFIKYNVVARRYKSSVHYLTSEKFWLKAFKK